MKPSLLLFLVVLASGLGVFSLSFAEKMLPGGTTPQNTPGNAVTPVVKPSPVLRSVETASSEDRNEGRAVKVVPVAGPERNKEILTYRRSLAVLIGISNYEFQPKLPGVINDIDEVAKVLKYHGFDLIIRKNVEHQALINLFQSIRVDLKRSSIPVDRLLIYFAGHGCVDYNYSTGEDIGYLLPADAAAGEDVFRKAISMAVIKQEFSTYDVRHALFVFDCCFGGQIFGKNRDAITPPAQIREFMKNPVRIFLASGAADQTVPDKSVFREYFVEALYGRTAYVNDGFLSGSELCSYLYTNVVNREGQKQTPRFAIEAAGDFSKGDFIFQFNPEDIKERFKLADPDEKPSAEPPTPPPSEQAWQEIRKNFGDYHSQKFASDAAEVKWLTQFPADKGLMQWHKAAQQGLAEAQYLTGRSHELGAGVAVSLAEARQWYERAADQGLMLSQFRYATLLHKGLGGPKAPARALEFYKKSADQGHSQAQYELGMLCLNGEIIKADRFEARRLFERAAQSGVVDAEYEFARMCETASGGKKDVQKAKSFYQKAASQGHTQAMEALKRYR